VLVNLRVLSQLQSGDRVNAESNFFAIERGFMTSIWRWWRAENRERTLSRISEIFHATQNSVRVPDGLMEQACKGLRMLKTSTYAADPTTCARLDNIIEQWQSCLPSSSVASAPSAHPKWRPPQSDSDQTYYCACQGYQQPATADHASSSRELPASPASSPPPSSPVPTAAPAAAEEEMVL